MLPVPLWALDNNDSPHSAISRPNLTLPVISLNWDRMTNNEIHMKDTVSRERIVSYNAFSFVYLLFREYLLKKFSVYNSYVPDMLQSRNTIQAWMDLHWL